jgi:hypothetical protein
MGQNENYVGLKQIIIGLKRFWDKGFEGAACIHNRWGIFFDCMKRTDGRVRRSIMETRMYCLLFIETVFSFFSTGKTKIDGWYFTFSRPWSADTPFLFMHSGYERWQGCNRYPRGPFLFFFFLFGGHFI